ncbi:MAG: DUF1127 domain-containing protein [Gammaproteobacteria bacterium]|nr:DUF1127 domain-containing protein [Gammaproteobacteria bacterium]
MTTVTLHLHQTFKAKSFIKNILTTAQLWIERSYQRKQLLKLSYKQLEDIGLTYEQIRVEAKKPFWK